MISSWRFLLKDIIIGITYNLTFGSVGCNLFKSLLLKNWNRKFSCTSIIPALFTFSKVVHYHSSSKRTLCSSFDSCSPLSKWVISPDTIRYNNRYNFAFSKTWKRKIWYESEQPQTEFGFSFHSRKKSITLFNYITVGLK